MAHIILADRRSLGHVQTRLTWEGLERGVRRLLNQNCSNMFRYGYLKGTTDLKLWIDPVCVYDSSNILPYLYWYNLIEVSASPGYKFSFKNRAEISPHNARLVEEKRIHVYFEYTPQGVYISAKITPDCFSYMLRCSPDVRDSLGIFYESPAPPSGAAPLERTFLLNEPGFRLNAFNFTAKKHPVDEDIPPFIKFIRPAEDPDDLASFLHVIFGLLPQLENPSHWGGPSSVSPSSNDEDLPYTSQPHNHWSEHYGLGVDLQ
jgi:hypothetical protein